MCMLPAGPLILTFSFKNLFGGGGGGGRVQQICILQFIIRTAAGVCSLDSVCVSMEQLKQSWLWVVSVGTVLRVNTTVCQYWIVNSLYCLYFAAVIEHVRDGCTVRAFLLPKFDYVTVMLSGVKVRVFWMDFFFKILLCKVLPVPRWLSRFKTSCCQSAGL